MSTFYSDVANGDAVFVAGVVTLNDLAGALTLAAGSNITITPSGGDTLTISASGGGGGLDAPFVADPTGYSGSPLLGVDSTLTSVIYFASTNMTTDTGATARVQVSTGSNSDAAGTSNTGELDLQTGNVTGPANKSGDIYILNGTADSAGSTSGNLYLNVETDQGTAGYTFLGSHEAPTGGQILIEPGPSDSDDGATLTILSGGSYDTSKNSGDIVIKTMGGYISDPIESLFWGVSSSHMNSSGNIMLITEQGTSSAGNIQFKPGNVSSAAGSLWQATDTDGSGTWATPGADGSFTSLDGKTITVVKGIITSIV